MLSHFAKEPKHEVADGSLKPQIKLAKHENKILAGEEVALYDAIHDEPIENWSIDKNLAEELFQGAKHFVPSNGNLKTFVQAFRDAMRSILLIRLREDEFDPFTADDDGVKLKINEKVADIVAGHNPDKKSFFMIGVDAVGEEYLK